MLKSSLFLASAVLLSGCVSGRSEPPPEPIVQVVEKVVPGPPAACVPANLGGRPEYVDTDSALISATDAAVRYALLWAGREQRIAREEELEAAIKGCPKEETE